MALAGALEILISAGMQQLVTDMNSAKNTVNSAMSNISSAVNTAKSVLGTLGIAFSVNHFATMIRNSISAQAEMYNLSQKIGTSVEDLSGLSFAAQQSDISMGTLEKGLRNLVVEIGKANSGAGDSAAKFRAMGVELTNSNGDANTLTNILGQMSGYFSGMPDGIEKTNTAIGVLGARYGTEFIPMLNDTEYAFHNLTQEGREFSGMTTASAAAAEALGDRFDAVKSQMRGYINETASFFVTSIADTMDYINRVKPAWTDTFDILSGSVEQWAYDVDFFIKAIGDQFSILFRNVGIHGVSTAETLQIAFGTGLNSIYSLIQIVTIESASAIDRMRQKMRDQKLTMEEQEANMAALDRARMLSLSEVTGKYGEQMSALYDQVNASAELRAEYIELGVGMGDLSADFDLMTDAEFAAWQQSQALRESVQGVSIETALSALNIERLTSATGAWVYPTDAATGSVGALLGPLGRVAPTAEEGRKALDGMTESIVRQIDPMETYKNLVQGIQNDWADLIYNTLSDGKINFKDFFDSVLQGFLRMIAQMAAADLANAIFGGQGLGGLTGGNIAGMINGATGGGGGGGIAGAIGSTVSSIFGGGTAAATAANSVGPMASGYLTAGGTAAGTAAGGTGIMASIGAGISSAASTIWGGVTGTASAIGGGMSAAGSAVMGALQAIPGWGWALAGLGLAAAALDSGGTYSHNAGFLLQPVAGMEGRTFDVDAFDSGFDPIGFNRRTSVEEASAVIDTFRTYDAVLTKLARDSGMNVNYSNAPFNGYDEKGLGNGLFYGSAEEDDGGKGTALDIQLNKFVADWIRALGYQIDPSARDSILAGGTADEMIARAAATMAIDGSHASGLNYVPWDGYKAVLHKGERVQTDAEARAADRSSVELRAVREVLQATQSEMSEMKRYLREMFLINAQWNDDGLPPERV